MDHYVERVVDLTEPEANRILNQSVEEARALLFGEEAEAIPPESRDLSPHRSRSVWLNSGDGALPRQADALLSCQTAGRTGARCCATD